LTRDCLLSTAAFGASGRFGVGLALVGGQREELLALGARTDFKIGGAIRIDIRGKEEFVGVVANCHPVAEFHDGQTVIEDLEGGFLSLPFEYMTHHEHRLALPLGAKVT
jgi:hypothetical protein